MMEYPRPIYIQKLSLLREALSAAHLSMFRTLKNARARARSCSRNSHPSFHRGLCPAGVAPCTPAFPCPNSFRAATHPFGLGNCATPSARGRDAGNSVAQTRRAASLAVGPWNRFQNPLRHRRQISAQARVRKDPCSVPRRAMLGLTLRRHSSRRLLSWS